MKNKHYAGENAMIDAFSGLIPCKVQEIKDEISGPCTFRHCIVEVKKDMGGYKKGEQVMLLSHYVVPKVYIRKKSYSMIIKTDFEWIISKIDVDK